MGGDHHWPEVEVRLRVQLHRAGERLHPVPRVLQGRVRERETDLFKIILVILGFLSSCFSSFFNPDLSLQVLGRGSAQLPEVLEDQLRCAMSQRQVCEREIMNR